MGDKSSGLSLTIMILLCVCVGFCFKKDATEGTEQGLVIEIRRKRGSMCGDVCDVGMYE